MGAEWSADRFGFEHGGSMQGGLASLLEFLDRCALVSYVKRVALF
jgi:hypothetical protein